MSWRTISHSKAESRKQKAATDFSFRLSPLLLLLVLAGGIPAQAVDNDAFRGLWVGTVKLSYVTEVPVALNSNNVAVAPGGDLKSTFVSVFETHGDRPLVTAVRLLPHDSAHRDRPPALTLQVVRDDWVDAVSLAAEEHPAAALVSSRPP